MSTANALNQPQLTLTQYGIMVGGGASVTNSALTLTDGQILIGATGAAPVAGSITAGAGITVTPGTNTITIAATGTPETCTEVTGTSATAVINNAYVANNASLVTITLPATCVLGSKFTFMGKGAGFYKVQAASGQTINFGSTATTVAGSITTTGRYDSFTVRCITADTTFVVYGAQGSSFTVA